MEEMCENYFIETLLVPRVEHLVWWQNETLCEDRWKVASATKPKGPAAFFPLCVVLFVSKCQTLAANAPHVINSSQLFLQSCFILLFTIFSLGLLPTLSADTQ